MLCDLYPAIKPARPPAPVRKLSHEERRLMVAACYEADRRLINNAMFRRYYDNEPKSNFDGRKLAVYR